MRDEAQFLFDMLDACESIEQFLRGKTEAEFATDDQLQSAVLMKLFIIGEASTHILEKIQEGYGEVPWSQIRGFRNFVAHHYFRLRSNILWNSATVRVAELGAAVREIMRCEFPRAEREKA